MNEIAPVFAGERKLDAAEVEFARVARDYNGSQRCGALVTLSAPVAVESVRVAVRAVEERHPFVKSVLKDWTTIAQVAGDAGVVQVQERSRSCDLDWHQAWREIQIVPLELNAPLWGVCVLQDTKNSSSSGSACDIIISAEHFVSDGASIMQFTRELLELLADPGVSLGDNKQPSPSSLALCKKSSSPWFLSRARSSVRWLSQVVGAMKSELILDKLKQDPNITVHHSGNLGALTNLKDTTIAKEDMARLSELAKAKGITLNPLLCSVALHAARDLIEPEPTKKNGALSVSLLMTVNLRPFYSDKAVAKMCEGRRIDSSDFGMHSGAMAAKLTKVNKSATPEDIWAGSLALNKAVILKPEDKKSVRAVMAGALMGPSQFKLIPIQPNPKLRGISATVSNWGKVPLQTSYKGIGDVLRFRGLINYAVAPNPYIDFTSLNGKLDITVILQENFFSQKTADLLAQRIKDYILSLIN